MANDKKRPTIPSPFPADKKETMTSGKTNSNTEEIANTDETANMDTLTAESQEDSQQQKVSENGDNADSLEKLLEITEKGETAEVEGHNTNVVEVEGNNINVVSQEDGNEGNENTEEGNENTAETESLLAKSERLIAENERLKAENAVKNALTRTTSLEPGRPQPRMQMSPKAQPSGSPKMSIPFPEKEPVRMPSRPPSSKRIFRSYNIRNPYAVNDLNAELNLIDMNTDSRYWVTFAYMYMKKKPSHTFFMT
jgi:hypothetical protein